MELQFSVDALLGGRQGERQDDLLRSLVEADGRKVDQTAGTPEFCVLDINRGPFTGSRQPDTEHTARQSEFVIHAATESFVAPIPHEYRPAVVRVALARFNPQRINRVKLALALVLAIEAEQPVHDS